MGNGIAVILLHTDQTKFEKRSSTRGISRTAYLGRLIHTLSNMIYIVIIEEDNDEESVFGDEDMSSGQGLVGKSADSDTTNSEDYGLQESEFESSNCQMAERCEDVRNGYDRQGLGESVDATESSNEDGVEDKYSKLETSDCLMAEEYCSEDDIDTSKDKIYAVVTMEDTDSQ